MVFFLVKRLSCTLQGRKMMKTFNNILLMMQSPVIGVEQTISNHLYLNLLQENLTLCLSQQQKYHIVLIFLYSVLYILILPVCYFIKCSLDYS
jgi:hypothetical protein